MTLIASVYHMVAHWSVPALYNYWAILGLDILLVVMWLCSFALLAARVAATYAYVDDYYSSYSYYGSRSGLSATANALLITQALAASLGAVELCVFILFIPIFSPKRYPGPFTSPVQNHPRLPMSARETNPATASCTSSPS
ncbi:hypothetical protein N658DRAFT_496050 [Parathielavia hyrcaniae]|uniref:MARVEL domain-containing protein n=1 Tax=Parathielavia hyrcaniae TaxID=113614 RepID=A0AAN6T2G9_9PEZI|nr:hypothetical protein N658DRAFT_496050 [Parathielavia hyrcaniae]